MDRLFISHSSQDDGFVRELRAALANHGHDGWIDSRELRGGNPLWPEIQKAIEEASAYAVVVSPGGLQSNWVGKELRRALEVQEERGRDKYPVIPLSLNGTKLGVLEEFFDDEPLYIPVSSGAGGVEAALNPLLIAMGERLPADMPIAPQPKPEPLEELVLELTDLKFHEQDGVHRAEALAELVYEPATPGMERIGSENSWQLVAPIGPIDLEEIRWYLEKYAIWPSEFFKPRAYKVEQSLKEWGQALYDSAFPKEHVANIRDAWAKVPLDARRRFSVFVKSKVVAGASQERQKAAREAATKLLGLPWELLHDGDAFLFQGAHPTRVRRRLPATKSFDVPVMNTPIRILLITARPEDDSCSYIDHRASALPLVEAMESLPGLVKIHVLSPPTLGALREELDRAGRAREPYHVVHFDGHGVYARNVGLGALCFEHPEDIGKLDGRRHLEVTTEELGPLLRDHRIPLVFLEACQTAQAEKAAESVASELLKIGVASVVAMSHSVLVETARRFVEAFYDALGGGARVGDAMLAGQRKLNDDKSRGRIFGVGELELHDWFVPVLFQEKADPQLFHTTPSAQTLDDFQMALAARLGELPAVPATGFIGRSRELLALQRLLRHERYAVVRGQGGEGKTALAAEFARWMVRSHQMRRAAFVSVEGLETNIAESTLDKLGHQLLRAGFSTQADCQGSLDKAEQEIERALREQATLVVVDNMESILLPQFIEAETPEALSQEAREELEALLRLCQRLNEKGDTRLLFTSREALPAPFDGARHRRELHELHNEDAVKLVERVLNVEAIGNDDMATFDAAREEIERLVDAVHGHARTLALLAPALRERGVEKTRASLVDLMAEMEKKFPGSREKSVFASIELSLCRMSGTDRDRARVLGAFHGGVDLDVLAMMMEWEKSDVASLAVALVGTGLATPDRYNHLTLNPALCPYLRGQMDRTKYDALKARWVAVMLKYVEFLGAQQLQNAELAATLAVLELANLFPLLDFVQSRGDAEKTIALTTALYSLLQKAGKPRLTERVGQVRDKAATALGDAWNHARFEAVRTRIEQQLDDGQVRAALDDARTLLQRARAAGEHVYPIADYDLAVACILFARVLNIAGGSEQALPLLEEAQQRFETIAKLRSNRVAETMASICLAEQGTCLFGLGRLDEAAAVYEENIRRAERLNDMRQVAVGKGQLGSVRMDQGRYPEALAAHAEARQRFAQLNEPGTVAVSWHQTGMVYAAAGEPEAAEDAYRRSLAIAVRLGDVSAQASTLGQLGTLYQATLNRPEEAAPFFRQAADKYVLGSDVVGEGRQRTNLAVALRLLGRLDEARQEIRRAIECKAKFGHAASPWSAWATLADIETDAGDSFAATEAKRKAINSYLGYRRDGGENHEGTGRLVFHMIEQLRAGGPAAAATFLQQLAANPKLVQFHVYIRALQEVLAGSRGSTLADSPHINYKMAAEILLLIETLEKESW